VEPVTIFMLLLFLGPPFWEAAPPAEWSDSQIEWLLRESAWAYHEKGAQIYLASAWPVWQAERERYRRRPPSGGETSDSLEEYFEFLEENRDRYIVLAVHILLPQYLLTEKATRRMEERCVMIAGGKKHKLVGHFPPTPNDRYLRLVFPRVKPSSNGSLRFQLYVPGVPLPFRRVEFDLSRMKFRGNPTF